MRGKDRRQRAEKEKCNVTWCTLMRYGLVQCADESKHCTREEEKRRIDRRQKEGRR